MSLAGAALATELHNQVKQWLTQDRYADVRPALQDLVQRVAQGESAARSELEDAFSQPLPIGTGGRRGTCGPGPNRMNLAVLRETAQGLADAMQAEGAPNKVAVVYDTRKDSRRFAAAVARQLAACGAEVLLVDAPRPTPQLSYIVRARGCGAGVVISASHNPPEDNGIKVYGPDGAQVLGRRDTAVMNAIKAAMLSPLKEGNATTNARVETIAGDDAMEQLDRPYLDFVCAQGVAAPDLSHTGIKVVYTPLHGVGHSAVLPVLRRRGITVDMVAAQGPDDGVFGTLDSANPEQPAALELARQQAVATGADLVVASDPDADRLGALARDKTGNFKFIDGNQLAVLMLDHVLRNGTLAPRSWVLTTLVSSPLIGTLGRAAGVEVVDDLLVGFKHHAGMMDEQPDRPVVFATEEAHGYLRGNDVHDKDGAVAALLLAEAAALAKVRGETLFDQLTDVWLRHGYHREQTANIYAYGAVGREAIASLVDAWRQQPPTELGGLRVVSVTDRSQPRDTGSATRDLPGNVLVFELEAPGAAACRLVLRPSGTEPKVKVYALTRSTTPGTREQLPATMVEIDAMVERVLGDAEQRAQAVMAPLLSQ